MVAEIRVKVAQRLKLKQQVQPLILDGTDIYAFLDQRLGTFAFLNGKLTANNFLLEQTVNIHQKLKDITEPDQELGLGETLVATLATDEPAPTHNELGLSEEIAATLATDQPEGRADAVALSQELTGVLELAAGDFAYTFNDSLGVNQVDEFDNSNLEQLLRLSQLVSPLLTGGTALDQVISLHDSVFGYIKEISGNITPLVPDGVTKPPNLKSIVLLHESSTDSVTLRPPELSNSERYELESFVRRTSTGPLERVHRSEDNPVIYIQEYIILTKDTSDFETFVAAHQGELLKLTDFLGVEWQGVLIAKPIERNKGFDVINFTFTGVVT